MNHREISKEIIELRESYVGARPKHRLRIIQQRLENPHASPNLLVTKVASIEAFARCLVMEAECKNKQSKVDNYQRYRYRKPHTLIEDILKLKGKSNASEFFGKDTWAIFRAAVECRNILAHECTYLDLQKFTSLEAACDEVLNNLIKLSKLSHAT